jgi:hypothetical protein
LGFCVLGRKKKVSRTNARFVDVAGQKFGLLTVVAASERKTHAGKLWQCQCDCGGQTVTTSLKLRSGHTTSCGCVQKARLAASHRTHGRANKDRTYKSWKEMRRRCLNLNADQYKWYGGRGITICARWSDFENFVADMGERPSGTSLDRINPDGPYEPQNCRWATAKQQAETNRGLFKKGLIPWNKRRP